MTADSMTSVGPIGPVEAATAAFAEPLRIADCTLRDGEQQAGVVFRADDKLAIARELDSLGVYEIEAGMPAVSPDDAQAVGSIVEAGLQARVSVLTRALARDIDQAADLGVWGVRLSLPISSIQRRAKIPLSDGEYVNLALRMSEHAKSRGLYVVFSPYDTTRADVAFLEKFLLAVQSAGTVDRLRIVDTSGCATPATIAYLVEFMHARCEIPVEVHCHDDLGLAVANTLGGALAGAEYLSVTVNGLGERCGNAALEEVLVALRVLYGLDLGVDLTRLKGLSDLVQELSGVKLHPHKSVVGAGAFAHESGMVVAGVLQDPFTAECYSPQMVGQTRQIVLGKLSGLASVQDRLRQHEVVATDEQARRILDRVKAEATETKDAVGDERFRSLTRDVLARRD